MWFFASLVIGFIGGVFLTLLLQCYFFRCYFTAAIENSQILPTTSSFAKQETIIQPEELLKLLDSKNGDINESCLSLNFIFQFLFNELHNTSQVRRWFIKKLSVEFEELLQRTTTGKLLEQITIQDLYFGTHFPLIKSLSVKDIQLHNMGYIQELDVVLELEYNGGFQLSISVDMVFGRSAFLSVKVSKLKGLAQLRFTRIPYTHWSFAFCDEPVMDLQVESHFQGHLLPKVTALIISQIRRTVRKRHTLPNYKIRYKPFFMKPDLSVSTANQSMCFMGSKLTEGLMEVTIVECTRLFPIKAAGEDVVYCTLAIDSSSWVDSTFLANTSWLAKDVELSRTPNQTIGVAVKQEFILDKYENCVMVESVAINSPACVADIKKGDLLVSVNGVKLTSAKQAVKLFKQPADQFNIRIERRSSTQTFLMEELVRDDDSTTSGSHGAVDDEFEDSGSTDSGSKGSPIVKSPLSQSPAKRPNAKSLQPVNASYIERAKNTLDMGSMQNKSRTLNSVFSNRNVLLKNTSSVKFEENPKFNETVTFEVGDYNNFLNLCVFHRVIDQKSEKQEKSIREEKDTVLGHVSILLADIATECAFHRSGFYRKTFQLLPPEPKPIASRNHKLARHPGFDESLCYGDITLAFTYKPKTSFKEDFGNEETLLTENLKLEPEDEGFSILSETLDEERQHSEHDFIITQFYNTIFCKCCGKKVWFKLAFQCRSCNVVCHKKCVTKFQAATSCSSDGIKLKQGSVSGHTHPEIVTTHSETTIDDNSTVVKDLDSSRCNLESPRTQRRLSSLLSSLASSTKNNSTNLSRAGSVHNLAIPSQPTLASHSKSLPPSPQSSPGSSRKTSLQGGLFQTDQDFEMEEDLETVVQRLLPFSNDEMLVSIAKEKGRDLFVNLSLEERKQKLNEMIEKLQCEINVETKNRSSLEKDADVKEKTKTSCNNIAKSNEKIQALAVLLLYYCSGLQHCQEIDDSLKKSAASLVASTSGSKV